jgi:hypothetical protein
VAEIRLLDVLELEKLVRRKPTRPVMEGECILVDNELGLLCDRASGPLNTDRELASTPEKREAIANIAVEKDPKKALTGENRMFIPVIVSLRGHQS